MSSIQEDLKKLETARQTAHRLGYLEALSAVLALPELQDEDRLGTHDRAFNYMNDRILEERNELRASIRAAIERMKK